MLLIIDALRSAETDESALAGAGGEWASTGLNGNQRKKIVTRMRVET